MPKSVFVFGSNAAGIHGAGAAKVAWKQHGARYGKGYGHHGDTFAIPTKDEHIETLPLPRIEQYVQGFLAYAKDHRKLTFQVTRIGCGLAGYKDKDIAPLFKDAPLNCQFDEAWKPFLGDAYTYWGTC
uniref:ADP-ribosylglycohydrolase n=1 Tax=Pseudomonas phage Arace01 TaxID=3138526 RepID=A0AAU6VZ10_9VIRU